MKQVLFAGVGLILFITIVAFGVNPVTHPLPELRIAVFQSSQNSEDYENIMRVFNDFDDLIAVPISVKDIENGALNNAKVLIICDDAMEDVSGAMTRNAARAIENFISGGGGFIGIDGGAALPCNGAGVIDADYHSGAFVNNLRSCQALTKNGTAKIPFQIQTENIISFAPGSNPYLPDYVSLACYSDGNDAIIASWYGRGRALLFGPHPERTSGMEEILAQACRWSAGKSEPRIAAMGPEFGWEGIFGVSLLK